MNKILVAINGTTHSDKTLASAAEIAKKENGELVILYTCDDGAPSERQLDFAEKEFGRKFRNLVTGKELPSFSVNDSDGTQSISEYMQARKKLCAEFSDNLLQRASSLVKRAGVSSFSTRMERGDVTKTVLEVAKTETAGKIVVGNCSKNNWSQFFTGCKTKEILKKAHCTAIVVD